ISITSLRPDPRTVSAFFSRYPSTNGPFQTERGMTGSRLLQVTRAQNVFLRRLVRTCALALGRLAPRGDRMTADRGALFGAAVRMVDRVHGHAANGQALALPARAARLASVDVRVVRVAPRAHRRHALVVHQLLLARI